MLVLIHSTAFSTVSGFEDKWNKLCMKYLSKMWYSYSCKDYQAYNSVSDSVSEMDYKCFIPFEDITASEFQCFLKKSRCSKEITAGLLLSKSDLAVFSKKNMYISRRFLPTLTCILTLFLLTNNRDRANNVYMSQGLIKKKVVITSFIEI